MLHKQKETILAVLKSNKADKNYERTYWFSYQDFLDPEDNFTSFSCEELDGKRGYIALIEKLLRADETAKVFVEVYGFEEVNSEPFIYAETLIIFSKLSLSEVRQIFSEPEDIFPDDIGEVTGQAEQSFIIGSNGEFVPAARLFCDGASVYYCWWD